MRPIQKELTKRYREIANKHGVDLKDILEVETSIWKMVAEKMGEGDKDEFSTFHNIYLSGLGTFVASEGLHRYVTASYKKKNNND